MTDVAERERFEARDDPGDAGGGSAVVAGFVTYQVTGGIVVYTHTEVSPAFEGKGVGSRLARAVMDDARARGRTVVPLCPFLAKWLESHHEFDDIVARNTRRVK